MKIYNNTNSLLFGRALSTPEKSGYKRLIYDAKKALGTKDTSAIIFDFNVPSAKGSNTGIGTTFSDYARNFITFIKDMTGITSIQLQPQGKITHGNPSPYSGTNFALGEHIIDLKKLSTPQYGELITKTTIGNIDNLYNGDKTAREFKTDYLAVLGANNINGAQKKALRLAYNNFIGRTSSTYFDIWKMRAELQKFKIKNKDWLEKEAMFSALKQHYGTPDITKWEETDRNLYSEKTPKETREKRIQEIKKQHRDIIDFEYFTQYIADKQQKESRNFLNFNNIALYGDCLLGFSKSEIWGNIDCFRDNLYYGGPDPNSENGIQTWRLRALNYDLIGECSQEGDCSKLKSAGKLLLQKFKIFFERYDGIRLDAAWQFITPFLYEYKNSIPSQVKTPEMDMTIFNIMKTAKLQAENQNPDSSIMLELVGLSSQRSKEKTLNKYPHLYTTAYSEYGENPKQLEERGYKKSGYYIGVSNHDNDSLNNLSRNHQKRELHTKGFKDNYDFDIEKINFAVNNYTAQSQEYKNAENFRTAKFGEIFTSPNQFFTLPDMFGMSERINTSGQVNDKNWTVRIPTDYENFYFSQLQKGYGLNLPKALAVAMEMNKIQNPELIKKCNEAAEILREEGPSTQAEADKALKDGKLRKVFKYEFIL